MQFLAKNTALLYGIEDKEDKGAIVNERFYNI